jgi:hypothetical protein
MTIRLVPLLNTLIFWLNIIFNTFSLCADYFCNFKFSVLKLQSKQSARPFLHSSELGHTYSLNRSRACFPPLVTGGGTHSLAGEGGYQFGRGDRHCGAQGTYIYYVLCG